LLISPKASAKDQLFQFNEKLYVQTDGVAMGSPLGPLLENVFMGSIEEILEREGKIPSFYKRYVDETLTMSDATSATSFLYRDQWKASLSWYAAT